MADISLQVHAPLVVVAWRGVPVSSPCGALCVLRRAEWWPSGRTSSLGPQMTTWSPGSASPGRSPSSSATALFIWIRCGAAPRCPAPRPVRERWLSFGPVSLAVARPQCCRSVLLQRRGPWSDANQSEGVRRQSRGCPMAYCPIRVSGVTNARRNKRIFIAPDDFLIKYSNCLSLRCF